METLLYPVAAYAEIGEDLPGIVVSDQVAEVLSEISSGQHLVDADVHEPP